MEPTKVRKIIHVDMDAFYASVEVRDRPELRGQPVLVGGRPGSRGVIMAASYEARKFGIRSAMASSVAHRLCPQAVFLPPNFEKYRAVSEQIRSIFLRYTDLVEPLSLDEAYLDLTAPRLPVASATEAAQAIKAAIREETELTASAGVAPNKFLAKIASEEKKPDGLFVIRPQDVARFLIGLPLGKIPGIGKSTQARFAELGVSTCGELQRLSLADLQRHFGKRGGYFHKMARGIDERAVEPSRLLKSVGIEDTFPEDHGEPAWLADNLAELARGLERRARSAGVMGRTLTLKLRFADFRTLTRSRTLERYTGAAEVLLPVAKQLLAAALPPGEKLRLLGLSLSQLNNEPVPELELAQLTLPLTGDGLHPGSFKDYQGT